MMDGIALTWVLIMIPHWASRATSMRQCPALPLAASNLSQPGMKWSYECREGLFLPVNESVFISSALSKPTAI